MSRRLQPQPGEVIDRTQTVSFTWDGKPMRGFVGDTVASALAASGVTVLSRSMKYHRPRGLLTADYWDPGALVQVGDDPNVRAAHRLVEEGMEVEPQNVWPSLDRDLGAVNGLMGRFLTPGFYYKTFIRPRALWKTYSKVLSMFAPGGRVDLDTPHRYHDKRYTHPDVVVAGGGPAGMASALAAAAAGARVQLVEHEHQLGGRLRYGSAEDLARLEALRGALGDSGVEVLTDSTVTGVYDDNWLAIVQRSHPLAVERLIKARAKMLIVAPGLIERPLVFAGNDRPGVMLSAAVRRLINLWAVRPGSRAVVLSANEHGDAAADDLERAGVRVVERLDARAGETVVQAKGSRNRLEQVIVGDGRSFDVDLLVTATGWTAPTSLLNMAGDRPTYDERAARFFPTNPPDNVLVAGDLAGDGSLDELFEHAEATGRLAAQRAAAIGHRLQEATARARPVFDAPPSFPPDQRDPLPRREHPPLFRSTTHGMLDLSEDISSKDILMAADEGYDSVELAKRYTTATMGSAQGKLETVNTVAVLAERAGQSIGEVGTTTWRPPFAPITLGALGGRTFEPVRVSSMQPWHDANGAVPIVAGQWIRPEHYGDPAAEVVNVRENVGIIDVTPLGKLDLRGPDVPLLLDLLYTNNWSTLQVGSVRYGMMCAEDGVVLDDGVTGRLGEQHYLMTTTSSGAAAIWEWVENWLQTERPTWRVHVTPVTTAYASINVAGPQARELVGRLVDDVDLDPEAFPYMRVRVGTVAGVEGCFMWRIGFTGELSYELHVPSGHGLHVWEALLEQGADLGIAPFGLEAQRIMRLEKGHFIVGQDTDGLTKAHSTGLGMLIKLEKQDFAGLPELAWSVDDALPQIVALQPVDPAIVPEEACQILRDGTDQIAGRITSSRFSPTLSRSICLGQVDADLATPGTEVTVQLISGHRIKARVMEHHAHFDPEGIRARG